MIDSCGIVHCHVQANLSKPYPDKTEHLPKPNDFLVPNFFLIILC